MDTGSQTAITVGTVIGGHILWTIILKLLTAIWTLTMWADKKWHVSGTISDKIKGVKEKKDKKKDILHTMENLLPQLMEFQAQYTANMQALKNAAEGQYPHLIPDSELQNRASNSSASTVLPQ